MPEVRFEPTRFDRASRALRALAKASEFDGGEEEQAVAVLRTLAGSWADMPLSSPPRWSGLGADASGCDVSLVVDGLRREVRVTVEAQDDPPSPPTYWSAALRLSRTLETQYGADLSRLDAIADIFTPLDPNAAGVLWHGAVFQKGKPPWFKVYLHLMALGRNAARITARAAMERLRLGACWPFVETRLGADDELLFLSFDLVPGSDARVKLYVRHAEATAATLETAAKLPGASRPADVRGFVEDLTGGADEIIRRGALTSLQLRPGDDVPIHLSTHVRLYPHCATSDAVMSTRLRIALRRLGLPSTSYDAAIAALVSEGRADEAVHGWASIQWIRQRPCATVYFSPRLYFERYGPIGLDPVRMWPSPVGPANSQERRPLCAPP
ncbi:MAG: hypothetical protein HXX10_27425 [Rhodoplanes sp.]|uniref:tryptophan dimethylallyltransferase family protein n=1 Tax=Rhodoplanes sp. TaxID=1968906 RepID=UPI0017EB77C6|nr:tryptophan dimethylallyltransferase family protein [Rhodoplanes sp.]NVO17772.1 hypothetical protein [Rhodoplanes sp.]